MLMPGRIVKLARTNGELLRLLVTTDRCAFISALDMQGQLELARVLRPVVALSTFLANSETGRRLLRRKSLTVDLAGCGTDEAVDEGAWLLLMRELTGFSGKLNYRLHGPNLRHSSSVLSRYAPTTSADEKIEFTGNVTLADALAQENSAPDLLFIAHPGFATYTDWFGKKGLEAVPAKTALVTSAYSVDDMAADRAMLYAMGYTGLGTPIVNRLRHFMGSYQATRYATSNSLMWETDLSAQIYRSAEDKGRLAGNVIRLFKVLQATAVNAAVWDDVLPGYIRPDSEDQPALYLGTGLWANFSAASKFIDLEYRWQYEGVWNSKTICRSELDDHLKAEAVALFERHAADEPPPCFVEADMLSGLALRKQLLPFVATLLQNKRYFAEAALAMSVGHEALRALIMADPLAVLRENEQGQTLLWLAAEAGQLETVKLLAEAGADINHCDQLSKTTPLLMAAQREDRPLIRWLMQHGANASMPCTPLMTPLKEVLSVQKRKKMASYIERLMKETPVVEY